MTASRCKDLVSYDRKHNEANGEDNRDGSNECSWNCGHEGDTGNPQITDLRHRQTRNFIAISDAQPGCAHAAGGR